MTVMGVCSRRPRDRLGVFSVRSRQRPLAVVRSVLVVQVESMTARTWRCRGCLSVNGSRKRKCGACNKARPKRRRPTHLKALTLTYEQYVELNGGDHCGITTCERGPSPTRRLDRDHDHKTGKPRGLLCVRHNRMLDSRTSPTELRACADYLERAPRDLHLVPIVGRRPKEREA